MRYREETIRRFSEELKKRIVEEIEGGNISQADAAREYGMTKSAVRSWLEVYGKLRCKKTIVEVVMKNEKARIEELQKALAEAHLKLRIYDKMIEQANRKYKTDLKKTFGTQALENFKEKEPVSKCCAE